MTLIQNGFKGGTPGAVFSATITSAPQGFERTAGYQPGSVRAGYVSVAYDAIAQQQSYPAGNGYNNSWILAPKAGGMSWRPLGEGDIAMSGLSGRLMTIDLTGTSTFAADAIMAYLRTWAVVGAGDLTADIEGRAPIVVSFVGAGDIDATITGLVELSVALLGSGDLAPDLTGLLLAIVAFSGSGDIDTTLTGLTELIVALSGSGALTADLMGRFAMLVALSGAGDWDVTAYGTAHPVMAFSGAGDLDALITAFGDMTVDIVVTGTGLSTANVGQIVWQYLIEAGYSAEQIMRLLAAAAAGESAGGPDTPEYTGIDGVTVRIAGDADVDGNRSNVVLDAD